ncbi:hypothetical protein PUN28_013384 [Cardiocondyla obscurior]|uniref:Uncharacterized protein n=1 Tax=Cardiocondyla obscurior TaxID=286306 RepID=A0AAW2F9E5_9HYME
MIFHAYSLLNGDLRAVGVPRHFFLTFFFFFLFLFNLPLLARRMIVWILKCQSEGAGKEEREKARRNIRYLDSCHGHRRANETPRWITGWWSSHVIPVFPQTTPKAMSSLYVDGSGHRR